MKIKNLKLKGKTAVFIDAANMFYAQKTIGFKIDYKKLKRYSLYAVKNI